jgi:hypothetical protein
MMLLVAAMLLAIAPGPAGAVTFYNAGFETGDFSGWTLSPLEDGQVVSSHASYNGLTAWQPAEGDYFALVTAGDLTTTLSQQIQAQAGDSLSFWWFFDGHDYGIYNDSVSYSILDGTGSQVGGRTLASIATVGNYGNTPWTEETYTFQTSGAFTFNYQVSNGFDDALSSQAGLDMSEASAPVPEPLTLAALGLGIAGLGRYVRRRGQL